MKGKEWWKRHRRRKGGRQRDGGGYFSNSALKGCWISLFQHHEVSMWCGSTMALRDSVTESFLHRIYSSVLSARLFEEESSQMLLSCSSGSMSSSLPRSGVLARLHAVLLLWLWTPLPLLYSGMNTATRKDIRTIHAPNKNGGPGMTAAWWVWGNKRRWEFG